MATPYGSPRGAARKGLLNGGTWDPERAAASAKAFSGFHLFGGPLSADPAANCDRFDGALARLRAFDPWLR